MRNNVRPFRAPQKNPAEWGPRILVAIVYLLFGYLFRFPSESHITLLLIFGLLYWIFIHQKRYQVPYLVRYHLLQGLILYFWLILAFLVLGALIHFLLATVHLLQLGSFVDPLLESGLSILSWVLTAIMLGIGGVLALSVLMDKTPSLPWISNNVRRWV